MTLPTAPPFKNGLRNMTKSPRPWTRLQTPQIPTQLSLHRNRDPTPSPQDPEKPKNPVLMFQSSTVLVAWKGLTHYQDEWCIKDIIRHPLLLLIVTSQLTKSVSTLPHRGEDSGPTWSPLRESLVNKSAACKHEFEWDTTSSPCGISIEIRSDSSWCHLHNYCSVCTVNGLFLRGK